MADGGGGEGEAGGGLPLPAEVERVLGGLAVRGAPSGSGSGSGSERPPLTLMLTLIPAAQDVAEQVEAASTRLVAAEAASASGGGGDGGPLGRARAHLAKAELAVHAFRLRSRARAAGGAGDGAEEDPFVKRELARLDVYRQKLDRHGALRAGTAKRPAERAATKLQKKPRR